MCLPSIILLIIIVSVYLSNLSIYLFNQYTSIHIKKYLLSGSATISPIFLPCVSVVWKVQLKSQKFSCLWECAWCESPFPGTAAQLCPALSCTKPGICGLVLPQPPRGPLLLPAELGLAPELSSTGLEGSGLGEQTGNGLVGTLRAGLLWMQRLITPG